MCMYMHIIYIYIYTYMHTYLHTSIHICRLPPRRRTEVNGKVAELIRSTYALHQVKWLWDLEGVDSVLFMIWVMNY